jgi:hypothetical protein
LFEHANQGVEISFLLIADIATEPSGLLALENHQLGESRRVTHRLSVIGNGPFRLGDGCVLVPKHVGPKPAIDGLLIGFEHIFAQAKAGMKEGLVIFVRGIEMVNQVQQGPRSKAASLALTSAHVVCDFD